MVTAVHFLRKHLWFTMKYRIVRKHPLLYVIFWLNKVTFITFPQFKKKKKNLLSYFMAISSMKYTHTRIHTNIYTQSYMYACMHIRRLEHMSCEEKPFSDRTYVKQQFFNCLNFFITVFHWKHMKTALCHFPFPFCFKEGKPRKNIIMTENFHRSQGFS